MPKVSIIMPVYNSEKHIEEAIKSVLNQTYTDWELIIVDDASTDRSTEIINKLKTDKFNIISNNENIGPALSRNKAINTAKRKVCCFHRFG